MRNFLLRGPAGTGKTEGAKAVASGLHLPYRCLTCSANTEVFDLLGQILPDVDGKRTALERQYPSFQDIMLDPAGAYEKLTGTYDEISEDESTSSSLIPFLMKCTNTMPPKPASSISAMWIRRWWKQYGTDTD